MKVVENNVSGGLKVSEAAELLQLSERHQRRDTRSGGEAGDGEIRRLQRQPSAGEADGGGRHRAEPPERAPHSASGADWFTAETKGAEVPVETGPGGSRRA